MESLTIVLVSQKRTSLSIGSSLDIYGAIGAPRREGSNHPREALILSIDSLDGLTNDSRKEEVERTIKALDEILGRVDSLPVLDSSSPDEIIGYDRTGIPANVKAPDRKE